MKPSGHVFTILTLVAGLAVSRGSLLAATFSKPVALATDDLAGYRVSSAIDANADAIALWSGQYSFWPAGAAWSAAESFGGTGSPTQTVHMTATGAATAVWVASTTDVMTADLPLDGTWSAPLVLATGTTVPAPIFVMDSKGDADVVFLDNGEAVAYRRAAGASSWGAREIVATAPAGYDLQLSGAAMGEAGDFAFAWQTFQVICSRFCHELRRPRIARETRRFNLAGFRRLDLTDKGQALIRKCLPAWRQAREVITARLGADGVAAMRSALRKLRLGG